MADLSRPFELSELAATFAKRTIAARIQLAEDDPGGETEAATAFHSMTPEDWDADLTHRNAEAQAREATRTLTMSEAAMVEEIRGVGAEGLADYLHGVRQLLCRYVAFPSEHEPVAVAFWVAHAWLATDSRRARSWPSRRPRCDPARRGRSTLSRSWSPSPFRS